MSEDMPANRKLAVRVAWNIAGTKHRLFYAWMWLATWCPKDAWPAWTPEVIEA